MCLNIFSYKKHPDYKLIIAANRDEFYTRPTREAHFWEGNSNILGGRDMQHGGTWLGLNKNGKFAFITNYRDFSLFYPDAPSRGPLVSNYLKADLSPEEYVKSIEKPKQYNGFNLVVGDMNSAWYLSNVLDQPSEIKPDVHGVSNAFMDTPWQKVEKGKSCLMDITFNGEFSPGDLFGMLADEAQAPDDELPETGLPIEMERAASSMFIKSPDYGTVCSTVVMIANDGQVYFAEKTTNPKKEGKLVEFELSIST